MTRKHPRANDVLLSKAVEFWGIEAQDELWFETIPEMCSKHPDAIRWWRVTVDPDGIAWTWAE